MVSTLYRKLNAISILAVAYQRQLEHALRELEFRVAVTTAILCTLNLDEIVYILLSGITYKSGLDFDRALFFISDDSGRSLQLSMAISASGSADNAQQLWEKLRSDHPDFSALRPHFQDFRQNPTFHQLAAALAGFSLPLIQMEQLAASPHVLILHREAPLHTVLARCLVNRAPFCTNALTLKYQAPNSDQITEFRRLAVLPLYLEDRLLGAIVADRAESRRPVDSEDLRRLHDLGNLAVLAIDRARLHARTVAMAEVDGLTGVYNRRYYERELAQALSASRLHGQDLSIVVFDLDYFKQCNDQFGHLVGDEVLKDIARLLVAQVRQSDIVARYGGEEFVLLLKDTNADAAAQVAEKLRQKVSEAILAEGKVSGLTLSAGVACATASDTQDSLFERADRALYLAKQQGRNQTVKASAPDGF